MSRPAAPGSPVRRPGEVFGVASPGPVTGSADAEQVAQLRDWSVRLRVAAELQLGLRQLLLEACDGAGLAGPAGDALRELSHRLSADASASGRAAFDAADELDRYVVAGMLGLAGGDRP